MVLSDSIVFYNTRTRSKEVFRPVNAGEAGIYTCGPTVYGPMHIGNVRSQLSADLLRRFLVSEGFAVTHVINITDVGHLVSDADEGLWGIEKLHHRNQLASFNEEVNAAPLHAFV